MDDFRRPKADKTFVPPAGKQTPVYKKPTSQPYRQAIMQQAVAPAPGAARRRGRIDMNLPEGEGFNRHHMLPVIRRKKRAAKTWVVRGVLASLVLLVGLGGLIASQGLLNLNKIFKGTAEQAASIQEVVDPNMLKGEGDGRVNVLLVGIGGDGHDGGDLTDTLILASIDPVNNTAALLSIPRDMWVTIPGKGSMKINAAYSVGKRAYLKTAKKTSDPQAITAGFNSLNQTVERVVGVPINYNVLLNFQAFKQAVDTVDGVTVNVPEDLYDRSMAWENNNDPYLARAGVQDFDGKQALNYARSRHSSSDFARSERQQAVMLALKQKAVTAGVLANPAKISGLMGTFGDNVQTDLSLQDASRLYTIMKRIKNDNIQSISLAGAMSTTSAAAGTDSLITTGTINAQSVVMPKAGLENYGPIQEFVRAKLQDGFILKEKATVAVLNGTVETGLGQLTADRLKSYGYNVVSVANAPSTGYTSTVLVDQSKDTKKYTKRYLEQRFSTKATKTMPDATISPIQADFVVVLGGDETGSN